MTSGFVFNYSYLAVFDFTTDFIISFSCLFSFVSSLIACLCFFIVLEPVLCKQPFRRNILIVKDGCILAAKRNIVNTELALENGSLHLVGLKVIFELALSETPAMGIH